tara:strand:+ start:116 stop:1504 length:1389 start_codon:yes stop_codon:yes gene_type:complete
MAQRYGGKIVTDGLVLCLDAHDAKSYAGEPVTNMAYNIGILGHGSTWEAITSVPGSEGQTGPGANVNFKKLNDNSVANTFLNSNGKIFRNYVNNPATSDSSSFNNNGGFRYTTSINLTSGGASGYVIISFWCYLVTGYQGYGSNGLGNSYMQFQDSGGTYTGNGSKSFYVDGVSKSSSGTFNADTGRWKFVQLRFTKPTNSTAIRNFYIYSDKNTQGEMYVCQLQIEDRSDSGFYQVPFVEGASSRSATNGWVDRSGNSNDGTLVNGTDTGVSHYRDGQVIMPVANSYLDFDGTNDYVVTSSNYSLSGSQTFEVWFMIEGGPSNPAGLLTQHDYTVPANFGINHVSNNKLAPSIGYTDNTREYSSKTTVTTFSHDTLYHAALVYDSSAGKVIWYVNGVYDNQYTLSKTPQFAAKPFQLGRWSYNYNSYYYNGRVYKASVYGNALTAAEVLSNYNSVKPRFGL